MRVGIMIIEPCSHFLYVNVSWYNFGVRSGPLLSLPPFCQTLHLGAWECRALPLLSWGSSSKMVYWHLEILQDIPSRYWHPLEWRWSHILVYEVQGKIEVHSPQKMELQIEWIPWIQWVLYVGRTMVIEAEVFLAYLYAYHCDFVSQHIQKHRSIITVRICFLMFKLTFGGAFHEMPPPAVLILWKMVLFWTVCIPICA